MKPRRTSSIRIKLLVIFTVCIIGLSLIINFYSTQIFQKSYSTIEENSVVQDIERVTDTLDNTTAQISVRLIDWAWWDDTYQFMKDKNKPYIESNLGVNSISNIKINAMVFVNTNHDVLFKKSVNYIKRQEIPSDTIEEHVHAHPALTTIPNDKIPVQGLIMLPEGPMLVTAVSVLNSDAQGPGHGTLLFGKYFDSNLVHDVSNLTHIPVTVYNYNDLFLPADVSIAKKNLDEKNPIFVNAVSETTVAGYSVISDFYGQPAIIIKTESPRTVYIEGLHNLRVFVAVATIAIVLFGIIIYLFIEMFFVYRFSKLSYEVDTISQTKDFTKRVTESRKDGIGSVAVAINEMLNILNSVLKLEEKHHKEVEDSEHTLNEKVLELEKTNRLMVGRELQMIELKKQIEDLKNKK